MPTSAKPTGTPALTTVYRYDAADRLASVDTPTGPLTSNLTEYGYDAADHLTRITNPGGVNTTFGYDLASQLATSTTPTATTTFSYDPNGNRTTAARRDGTIGVTTTATYAYDQANRLIASPVANTANANTPPALAGLTSNAVAYHYTGDGLLSALMWDRAEGMPLPLIDTGNNATYVNGPDGLPIEQISPAVEAPIDQTHDQVLYYHHDQLGSTQALTDKDAHLVLAYTYNPYGKAIPSTTSILNPFTYAGQYTDRLTGLVYMRARWYDPTTGQFLTRDPITSLTQAPYSYAGDDPLNEDDPTGLNKCEVGANPLRWAGNAVDCASKVRAPDYVSIDVGNVGLPIPVIGPFVGWDVNLTVTRSGHVYLGGGGVAGTPGPFGSIRGGWINGSNHPSDCTIDQFNDHWGTTASGQLSIPGLPVGPSVGRTYGGNGTWSNEVGVGAFPSAGASQDWSGRLPFDLW